MAVGVTVGIVVGVVAELKEPPQLAKMTVVRKKIISFGRRSRAGFFIIEIITRPVIKGAKGCLQGALPQVG